MVGSYRVGEFEIQAQGRRVLRAGEPLPLGARAFDLLLALIEHRDRVVGKDELLSLAWPGLVVEENNLSVQVSALRKLLGADAIATVAGRGYRFTLPASESKQAMSSAGAMMAAHPGLGDLDLELPDKPSIAVLAFDNLSGDPEQAYFADGIAEDIITALSRFRQFHVTARNSSFTYKGRTVDTKTVGRELGVRYVLEGSVRKAGERVRITAQLIDAQSGNHVWAERYDGRLESIFDLQDEITNAIAAAVTPAFARAELQRTSRKRPESLDAWELSLRASQAYATGGPNDLAEARELAQRALLLDSRNTAALSLLSLTHATEALLGYSTSPTVAVAEAVKAARLAVREDSADADCLASLGFALLGARQYDEALDLLRQAVAQNPNSAWGFGVYGACLSWCGEYAECIDVFDKAMRLSPREPRMGMWFSLLALAAFIAGQYQEGVGYARRSMQCSPAFIGGHRTLAANLSALDQLDEARREVVETLRINPRHTVATVRAAAPFRDDAARERYLAALARAGLPD